MGNDKMVDGIWKENIDTSYIGKLNAELEALEDVDDDEIYNEFEQFVANKIFLKKLIKNGGLRYEYVQYHQFMKDTLLQDGIQKIKEVYLKAEAVDEEKTLKLLNDSGQAFTDAGDKWTQKAMQFISIADNGMSQRADVTVRNAMEYIGSLIEGTIKPYIIFIRDCISIIKVKDFKQLELGVMTQNIIDFDEVFKGIYFELFGGEKISDWRNVANHESYKLLEDDKVELVFGKNQNKRVKVFTVPTIILIAKQIDVLAYMHKISLELIRIDKVEKLNNSYFVKRKSQYKKKDDKIASMVEVASKFGMKCVNIDFLKKEIYLEEQNFSKETLDKFVFITSEILVDKSFEFFVIKGDKVHYTAKFVGETVRVMIWKV